MASPASRPTTDVEPPKRGQDVIAEAACADHRGDDHHVEREHDDLIDADEQLRPRRGQHDLEQHLPARGACHGAVLDDLARHGLQRRHGHAHHWRHGIDHGRDQRRHRSEAEQEQDRYEIGEDRHRLHEIEDRLHDPPRDRNAVAEDAEQHAAGHAERHGNRDRGERRHGACPLAEHGEVEEGASRKQRKTHAPEAIAERCHDPDHGDPRQRRRELHRCRAASAQEPGREDRGCRGQRHIKEGADRARGVPEGEQAEGCVFHQPLHEARDCLIQSEPPPRRDLLEPAWNRAIGHGKGGDRQHGKGNPDEVRSRCSRRRRPLVPCCCRRHHASVAPMSTDMTAARSTTPMMVPSASCTAKASA